MNTTKRNYLRASVCSAAFAFALAPMMALAAVDEIVVTAQKRAESIQDVPISISAFSGDFLEDSGIDNLQDLAFYAPNLYLSKSSQVANQRIAIRGVGSVGNNAIEPSVAVFIDGVYVPRPSSVVGNLQDIEAVEVLRGPQGTLFGRNASMGALNIRTKNPEDEFGGNVRVGAGNYNAYNFGATVNVPMSDKAAGRFAIDYSDRDGYGENRLDGTDVGAWEDLALRGAVNMQLSDTIDVTLRADYQKVENEGGVIEVVSDSVVPGLYAAQAAAFLDPSGFAGNALTTGELADVSDTYDYNIYQTHNDKADDEQWGLSADISWDVGEHTIRSITSYRDWQNDTFESAIRMPLDLVDRITSYETQTFSQEIQLLSPTGGFLEYVAGAYYYDEEYSVDQDFGEGADLCSGLVPNAYIAQLVPVLTAFPHFLDPLTAFGTAKGFGDAAAAICGAGGGVDGQFDQELTSYAVYGQGTLNFTDRLSMTGGLRWTKDEKEGSYSDIINNPVFGTELYPTGFPFDLDTALGPLPPGFVPGLGLRAPEMAPGLTFDDEELTWLLNASFDASDDIMLFATASTGYKSGGFNSEGAAADLSLTGERTYGSETTTNYELGMKSKLFDGLMTANVTLFQTTVDDFQDRSFDGLSFIVRNAGELETKGVEIDLQATPVDQLFVALSAGYLDSEFKSFPLASPLPATTVRQDLAGQRNHFSPEWTTSLVGQWTDQLASSAYDWYLRGEWQYVGEQNVGANTNNNPQSIQDAYDLFNARVGLASSDGKWELAMVGRNLSDEAYCQTIFDQPLASPSNGLFTETSIGGTGALQRCVLGSPRTYGVEAKVNF